MSGCIYWALFMRPIYKARNFYSGLSAFGNYVGNNLDKMLASIYRRVPSDRQYFYTFILYLFIYDVYVFAAACVEGR